jgi:hypothetical protein
VWFVSETGHGKTSLLKALHLKLLHGACNIKVVTDQLHEKSDSFALPSPAQQNSVFTSKGITFIEITGMIHDNDKERSGMDLKLEERPPSVILFVVKATEKLRVNISDPSVDLLGLYRRYCELIDNQVPIGLVLTNFGGIFSDQQQTCKETWAALFDNIDLQKVFPVNSLIDAECSRKATIFGIDELFVFINRCFNDTIPFSPKRLLPTMQTMGKVAAAVIAVGAMAFYKC